MGGRKIKILITNINLDTPHGSEIWCWTVAKELIKRGHQVNIYSRKYGMMAGKFLSIGCTLLNKCQNNPRLYDFGLLNHSHVMRKEIDKIARFEYAVLITHSKIQKVHGSIQPEIPPLDWDCKFSHVAVSDEVKEFWSDRVAYPIDVIPNPVASEFFDIEPLNSKTPRLIIWGNHRWKVPDALKRAAHGQQYTIEGGFNTKPPEYILKLISRCRIVMGTGRWLYEGMAAGRNCVATNGKMILGHVNGTQYQAWQNYNMTMRNPVAKQGRQHRFETVIANYNNQRGEVLRGIAREKHHVKVVVDRLLEV